MSSSVVETTASSSSSTTAQLLSNTGGTYSQPIDDTKRSISGTTTTTTTTTVVAEKDENERYTNDPLPNEVRKILFEVARTGVCQSLPWTQSSKHYDTASSTSAALHPDGAQPVAASVRQPSGSSQSYFDKRRSSSSSPFSNAPNFLQQASSRKPRNGLHLKRRRLAAESGGNANNSRVYLIRTSSASSSMFSHASGGAGRNSGSEVEDSTQYECDSEGTSATSASERSVDRREQRRKLASIQSSRLRPEQQQQHPPLTYNALRDVVRTALDLVLDHWYRRFGYTLTSAEKRMKFHTAATNSNVNQGSMNVSESVAVFQHRRQRLLALLQGPLETYVGDVTNGAPVGKSPQQPIDDGPPFTIQRIAEVLVAPEKYYTKTHKLCNCLEKLLLVTSSSGAFGGTSGGDTGYDGHEELDATTWADEPEVRAPSGQSKRSPPTSSSEEAVPGSVRDDVMSDVGLVNTTTTSDECNNSPDQCVLTAKESKEEVEREEAARVALRTKFDHEPNAQNTVRAISKSRSLTSSPPPPGFLTATSESQSHTLIGHDSSGGRLPKQQTRPERTSPLSNMTTTAARSPSPILFRHGVGADEAVADSFAMSSFPLQPPQNASSCLHSNLLAFSSQSMDMPTASSVTANLNMSTGNSATDGADLEVDPGRSSASNSDVDSESDDISLDDSASDRSDGSDSGTAANASLHLPSSLHEPFTAARVMALSRMHQQQQIHRGWLLQQSRGLMSASLNANIGSIMNSGDANRHQAEVGYQSGDSIDSMIAEDSGGSDSSSSDFAD